MKFSFVLAAILAVSTLLTAGCATKEVIKEVPVIKTVTRTVYPDTALMADCHIAPPPARKEYLRLNEAGKEKALVEYSNANVANLGKCNQDKKSLREWAARERAKEAKN